MYASLDVRKYVIARTIKKDGKKDKIRRPKIQRLVTPARLQRKRAEKAALKQRSTKAKEEATAFAKLLAQRKKDLKTQREKSHERRRLSSSKDTKTEAKSA